ncbi:hypothetical protein SAMN05445060_2795 [Williamsia sterculiae]|uniref:Uncharacterized protein n=1 Tax=Williamsia sterculiae TaxID=1344003 RepID=A0A1N7GHG1_9NOCA|nr:hypothetical protein SAMN05445060_2795 [Williamsia sterculiae]
MKTTKGVRHGENLLLPVGASPAALTKQHTTYIVGHSETGHHHVLESETPFDVTTTDEELYVRLYRPAKLVHKKQHDKHRTLTIQPGTYKVRRKTEYDPWQQTIREVFD